LVVAMAKPDDRDAEFIEAIVAAVTGLVVAVERGDRLQVIGGVNQLLTALIERRDVRPRAEALRRAVAQMSR
jgi:hypothetical protein